MATAAKAVKAAVAGSQVEPATAIQAEQPIVAAFPRDVLIVNDTPIPYVIARAYVAGGTSETITVNSDDEITRIKSDCEQIISLSDLYKNAEESPLRVTEVN